METMGTNPARQFGGAGKSLFFSRMDILQVSDADGRLGNTGRYLVNSR